MFCPAGKGLWNYWFSVPLAGPGYAVPSVLNTLCFSLIRCGCPRYAVPVLVRCACPKYAVPVLSTLSCPFAVPVLNTLCLFSIRCACRKYVELAFRCASSY